MSKLKEAFRSFGMRNNYGIIKEFGAPGDVAIDYHASPHGRIGWSSPDHTAVWSPFKHPSLDSEKIGCPRKEFPGNRAASFQLAINWAMGEFGHDYDISPFGGRVPRHVLQKARGTITAGDQP